jgi:uncharacterized protein YegL
MAGNAFEAVKFGLQTLLQELLGNPQALESAWLSVITFGRRAAVAIPLTDITQFQLPKLMLGSGTAMGAALELLEKQMKSEVVTQTAERKGDWKPICFILTDGDPTDRWEKAADRFLRDISGKKANVIAVACGKEVNIANLKRVTPTVLQMNDASEVSFRDFFAWVSASVQATSVKYASGHPESVALPHLPKSVELAQEGGPSEQSKWLFMHSRCSKSKRFYLVRYRMEQKRGLMGGGRTFYKVEMIHPIEEFDMEPDGEGRSLSVSTELLEGETPCPYCSNRGWGMCGCKGVLCMSPRGGRYTCPWCHETGNFSPASFDVGRGAG